MKAFCAISLSSGSSESSDPSELSMDTAFDGFTLIACQPQQSQHKRQRGACQPVGSSRAGRTEGRSYRARRRAAAGEGDGAHLHGHLGGLKRGEHAGLLGRREAQQRLAARLVARGAPHAMDVRLHVVRAVQLQHLQRGRERQPA
eukprot:scaffold833_cov259-Prasinococcus_capsulatus_cf.AAC.2